VESMLTDFEKFHPPQKKNSPSTFIDFIVKVSDIIAETNDNCSHDHFELQNVILAQNLMFITPSTIIDFPFLAPPPCLFQPPSLLKI
jgi:hypothetical protein